MRLNLSGTPKESISFPTFDYMKLVETDFEDSDFKRQLETKYLFVIYRQDPEAEAKDVYRLAEVRFWQMNEEDMEEARRCYEEMQRRVREGHADKSVTSRENRCCHVRPHARDGNDTKMTPYGLPVLKKCFWLNAKYIASELKKYEDLSED